MPKISVEERNEAIARLTAADGYALKPGDTIYSVVTHVSRSGMSRSIQFFIARDNEIADLTWAIARACGYTIDRTNGGLKTYGAGMDMCFATVYHLGRVLFPNGFDLAPNQRGRNGDTSGHDKDGGYAFKSSIL